MIGPTLSPYREPTEAEEDYEYMWRESRRREIEEVGDLLDVMQDEYALGDHDEGTPPPTWDDAEFAWKKSVDRHTAED